jgi:protein TonB
MTNYPEDIMFADSPVEATWANRSHREWTTLISCCMQTLLAGALLMIPLLYPEGLPSFHRMRPEMIGPPPSQGPAPKFEQPHARTLSLKSASGLVLMTPRYIPKGIAPATDAPVGPPPELLPGVGPGGGAPSVPGVLNSMGSGNTFVTPTRPIIHHPEFPYDGRQPHPSG